MVDPGSIFVNPFWSAGATLVAAFVLDTLVGDPRWLPHPIVYMGRAISFFERPFRRLSGNLKVSGTFFALFLILTTWLAGLGLVRLSLAIHPVVGFSVQALLLFYCFSVKCLVQAAMAVAKPLAAGDLKMARVQVSMIVGRQTETLDSAAVTRAAVETVAENFVDGFLSPLFFFLLLGVPGALAYKMVNTLDSMVGYKNDTYILFGRAAARMDDLANFIPARISVFIISLSAFLLCRQRGIRALQTARSDSRKHKSPNAGFPEAAFAGALGLRMGGPNLYHGKRVEKPFIGKDFSDPDLSRIQAGCELMQVSALTAVVLSLGVILLAGWMA